MTPPAATAAGRALPRTVAPRAPRRVSGPAARPRRGNDAPRRTTAPTSDPFVLRALRRTRTVADSRFLDRLIRGRLWVPLVAAGLMGIVFMQVSMLKLNAGIGRAVQSAATLERQNTNLRAGVSGMESGTRIDAAAHHLGMVVPADGSAHYVSAAVRGLPATAVHRMTPADPEAIARSRAAVALAAGQAPSTGTTLAASGNVAAAAVTPAATAPTTATQTAATAPTGTVASAPPASTTQTTGAATGAPAATTTPPPATTQQTTAATSTGTTGAAAAPTQQTTGTTTSGGAVAPPQG